MEVTNYRTMAEYHDNVELPGPTDKFSKKFLDPRYWKPKNIVMVDWKKWESLKPSVPKVYDPPQRQTSFNSCTSIPLWWWNRSWFCQPLPYLLCCGPKPERERISDDSGVLIQKLLGPNPDSEHVPEVFRNKLFWTEGNIAPETLISFNRWAWRSQKEESRVVGLGAITHDWTNDSSCFGSVFSLLQIGRFSSVQVSPDGKWLLLSNFSDPDGSLTYLWIYVVQEGDVFTTPDGKIIDNLKPGDPIRISWNKYDPYECNNDNLSYMYLPRVVATFDEKKGGVVRNDEHYGRLLQRATNDPDKCCSTCCYTCSLGMSAEDRFDFQVSNISDAQIFSSSPAVPRAETIDRL